MPASVPPGLSSCALTWQLNPIPSAPSSSPPQAIDLEAVCKARQHGVTVPPNGKKGKWAELKWVYKCRVRPWVLRLMAAVAFAASAVVVWSEATIGTGLNPDLSPFSLMVRSGASKNEFGEQVLVALPLAYMCACAYFSLLKLGECSGAWAGSGWWGSSRQGTNSITLLTCGLSPPILASSLHLSADLPSPISSPALVLDRQLVLLSRGKLSFASVSKAGAGVAAAGIASYPPASTA